MTSPRPPRSPTPAEEGIRFRGKTIPEIQALLRGKDSQPLKAINILKKLCNHPELLDLPGDLRGSDKLLPPDFNGAGASAKNRGRDQTVHCEWSGKFVVLERCVRAWGAVGGMSDAGR